MTMSRFLRLGALLALNAVIGFSSPQRAGADDGPGEGVCSACYEFDCNGLPWHAFMNTHCGGGNTPGHLTESHTGNYPGGCDEGEHSGFIHVWCGGGET